jgi:dUTP pyrophosphatase
MEKLRGFEPAKGWDNAQSDWVRMNDEGTENLGFCPMRATKNAAGYDFRCAKTTVIEPLYKSIPVAISLFAGLITEGTPLVDAAKVAMGAFKPTLVPTGVKSYMKSNEWLGLFNRSSNPLKLGIVLANGVGVIDSDYYSNPDNDGHIMFQFLNFGFKPVVLNEYDKLGQGIFQEFLVADQDMEGKDRVGGHGSTDETPVDNSQPTVSTEVPVNTETPVDNSQPTAEIDTSDTEEVESFNTENTETSEIIEEEERGEN